MNFGSPPEAAPAAQAPPRKPRDASSASPDTEDVSPPDSAGTGSPPYVLPLTPRNVGLEAMAEEDNEEEEEDGEGEGVGAGSSNNSQLDEAGGGGGKGSGRKRRRVVAAAAVATAALDLGSFAAGGAGGTSRLVFYRCERSRRALCVIRGDKDKDCFAGLIIAFFFVFVVSFCQRKLAAQNTAKRRTAKARRKTTALRQVSRARRCQKAQQKAPLFFFFFFRQC